jgi:hypothetical protein
MIGLMFMVAGMAWLAFSVFLALKVPQWLGIKTTGAQWVASALVFGLLLIGPFIDEIVGMQQFNKLCKERAVVWTAEDAISVTRAIKGETKYVDLPGYWIPIKSQQNEYINVDTGELFLKYEILHTRGGRIVGLVLLDGEHSCSPPVPNAMNRLNIDKLIKQSYPPLVDLMRWYGEARTALNMQDR